MGQEHSSEPVPADYQGSGLMRWLTKTGLGAQATSSMTFTSKIFFVCKDFQGVYAATAVSWAVTGVSWATVERNALRIATMILRPLEVSW